MTYQELIANIRDLGFSDDAEIEEFGQLVPNSINRAITEINIGVDGIEASLEIEITDDDTGYIYVDLGDSYVETFTGDGETTEFELERKPREVMSVIVDDEPVTTFTLSEKTIVFEEAPDDDASIAVDYTVFGDSKFLEFADVPVMFERNGAQFYSRFSDYEIENESILVINADRNKGKYRIFYKRAHDDFRNTEDEMETELPLNLRVHYLVPLLASYYVWLEDEPTKAAQYYNMFEQRKLELQEKKNSPHMRVLKGGI